jgi:tetratricopeptide (TPR) repeat protein
MERAERALMEDNPNLALGEYRRALDQLEGVDGEEALALRARAFKGAADIYNFNLGSARSAAQVYQELIAVCPETPEAQEGRVSLANLLRFQLGEPASAIEVLSQAAARAPAEKVDELMYEVAELYCDQRDYARCEAEAGRVADSSAVSVFVQRAAYLRAQAVARDAKRNVEAQRLYGELIRRFPQAEVTPHARFELGRLKAAQGDAAGAIDEWVRALPNHPHPENVQAAITRARAGQAMSARVKLGDVRSAFDLDIPAAGRLTNRP